MVGTYLSDWSLPLSWRKRCVLWVLSCPEKRHSKSLLTSASKGKGENSFIFLLGWMACICVCVCVCVCVREREGEGGEREIEGKIKTLKNRYQTSLKLHLLECCEWKLRKRVIWLLIMHWCSRYFDMFSVQVTGLQWVPGDSDRPTRGYTRHLWWDSAGVQNVWLWWVLRWISSCFH